ncbi:MAG: hypothetical protein WCR71_05040 [Bacteroidales bacterium]
MAKYAKYILYLLFGLGVVFTVLFLINTDNMGMLDTYLYYAYILFGLGIVLAIVLPLISMIQNPKSIKKMIFGIVLAAVVIGISYLAASGDPVPVNTTTEPTALTFKITDTGLILVYILLSVSFISIVAGSLVNMVRNR